MGEGHDIRACSCDACGEPIAFDRIISCPMSLVTVRLGELGELEPARIWVRLTDFDDTITAVLGRLRDNAQ